MEKKLSGGKAVFGGILKAFALTRGKLAAKLSGVDGFTGRGTVACKIARQGLDTLRVDLNGLAGRKAEIFLNETPAGTITIKNGRAREKFASPLVAGAPAVGDGSLVEIRQNGDVVLSGVLTRN